ncbi:MAG TPA: radical SAM protein, partial [Chloroflexota bacterium]|nr:radical SAM protein [Chloroflexota bacterium]
RQASLATHRIYHLPILMLMPHGGCNCRCVMCDIWKANADNRQLSVDDFRPHLADIRSLGVRRVVLTGGEALIHPNLWTFASLLSDLGAKLTLLTTGLLLKRHATSVARWCDEVIVSLDGPRDIHDEIRRIPRAFDQLAQGIQEVHRLGPDVRVTGRCVIQRRNYAHLAATVSAARDLGLSQISFLAADVSTEAFNRAIPWEGTRVSDISLSLAECRDLSAAIEDLIARQAEDFSSGFIAEGPDKLRRLPRYFAALHGAGDFPGTTCNAPWVSAVIEADGAVRPCFFHQALGNIHENSLETILNAPGSIAFRRGLNVGVNPICRKCVCTLNLPAFAAV